SPSSEALPGKLTLTTDNDVTLGSGPGEYSIPSFTTPTGEVVINSSLTVAPATSTKAGTNLTINSTKTSGPAITINNTGELIALLNATAAGPGGKIQLTSSGGTIHVNGGKITADRGTIEVVNNGAGGIVQLTSAQLAADIVKVRALGDNGALRIGGGMISADSTLKLYADGSNGTVEFVDDVSLNGNSAKTIAGNTVTIDNGKVVTIGGNSAASVFTNNANYSGSGGNNSTSGTFAGKGANTQPFIGKPGF
ncbi:MAG TPA: hypothetical protein VEO95_12850, partial [Chthoniobacteraceae bacterium]|nr:hypothetical protein [Chthoniobacteraceae bacterium]